MSAARTRSCHRRRCPVWDAWCLRSVDGRQVAEVRSSTVVVPMSTGAHHVVAELITADHRAFVPPITADTTLTVTGAGPIGPTPPCTP